MADHVTGDPIWQVTLIALRWATCKDPYTVTHPLTYLGLLLIKIFLID